MTTIEQNKSIICEFIDRLFTKGDLREVDELSPGTSSTMRPGGPAGHLPLTVGTFVIASEPREPATVGTARLRAALGPPRTD